MIAEPAVDVFRRRMLVAGEWREAISGGVLEVENPATGETIGSVPDAGPDDAVAALDAAVAAQDSWGATPPSERAEVLERAYLRVADRREELAQLMTLEMGKALPESRAEVDYAAQFLRWFAGEAQRIDGSYRVSGDGASRMLTMRQPVGPCYLITPWNFPLAMGARKIGPAIAAGCAMVVKPAQQTPLSMLALADLLNECGLPAGVLNVITTASASRVSKPILSDGRLRKLSFTGSTDVGRVLLREAAENVLNVSMELGGNAPFIVFEDAEIEEAVEGAMIAKMRNIGEACTAANRFYVENSIAERFADRLAERMSRLVVGNGSDPDVEVGPLIDEVQRDKVATLIEDAISKGAECLTGGRRVSGDGFFFEPTVLTRISSDAELLGEEIFGPVAAVRSFDTEQDVIAEANRTEYGLVAYVYTSDLRRALRVSERLESGMIGLNQGLVSNAGAPFGGVKQSGIGREGGNEGIEEYLETKYVAVKR